MSSSKLQVCRFRYLAIRNERLWKMSILNYGVSSLLYCGLPLRLYCHLLIPEYGVPFLFPLPFPFQVPFPGAWQMLNVGRDCWMLAISTFVVGTTYIIQLVPRGILIFRLSSILNLHIYQGYTSLYDSLHDFITHYKLLLMRLMTRMKLSQRKTKKHSLEKIIGNPSF